MNINIVFFLKSTILYPLVWCRRKHDQYLIKHNPEKMFSIWYKRSTGRYLNIDNPMTLYDKIAYMSFRTNTSRWSELADKVRVRNFVEQCGYPEILPKLYGTYYSSSEIDYDKLPKAFVLKTNNASATNILVKDKDKLDKGKANHQLDKWLAIDYGYNTCQPHYSRMEPLILAEEFLVDTANSNRVLPDYKFYCVNGKPIYVIVYTDRKANSHDMKRMIYDMNWELHQELLGRYAVAGNEIEKPVSFDKMVEIVGVLSEEFKFVRIDFYEVNGKPIFGEMTFTPGQQETSDEFMKEFVDEISL